MIKILLLLVLIVSCSKESSDSSGSRAVVPVVTADLLSMDSAEFEKSLSAENIKRLGVLVSEDGGVLKLSFCNNFDDGVKTEKFIKKLSEIFTNENIDSVFIGDIKFSKEQVKLSVKRASLKKIDCSERYEIVILQ